MKNKLKKIVASVIGYTLVFIFKYSALKRSRKIVVSIYFHDPSVQLFEAVVRFFAKKKFRFIDEQEYFDIVKQKKNVDESLVFVSFDDGWKSNMQLLPVIEKYNVKCTLFVPIEPLQTGNFWWEYAPYILKNDKKYRNINDLKKLDNYKRMQLVNEAEKVVELQRSAITKQELEEMNRHHLITIGSHSFTHPITITCTEKELYREYIEAKKELEKWLQTEVHSFSYPNGDFNEKDLKLVKQAGFQMAFSTNTNLSATESVYEIPRISINTKGGAWENIARALGLWSRFVDRFRNK